MLWSALVFGLLGSFHCIGMCGPIAFVLPLDRSSHFRSSLQLFSYHVGRLLTYSLLGFAFGLVGSRLQLFGLQQNLSIIIGVLMILAIVLPHSWLRSVKITPAIYGAVSRVKSSLGVQLKRKSFDAFFLVGFFNGLLPCGLVYMAIFGSLTVEQPMMGAAYMALFGLGTVPLMLTASYLGNFLKTGLRQKVRKAIPVLVIIMGFLFILRGMGLGIKYISPAAEVAKEQVTATQSCH